MNIDLRDSLLRFIVPPCLLWSVLYLFQGNITVFPSDAFSVSIYFIASGFAIAAIGTFLAWLLERILKPEWIEPLNFWRKIGNEEDYVRNKIEKVWSFYTMNLNASVALIMALLIFRILPSFFLPIRTETSYVSWVSVLLALFAFLSCYNFIKIKKIGKDLDANNPIAEIEVKFEN